MAKIKKAQNGTTKKSAAPTPTYKNLRMGVANSRKEAGQYSRGGYGASKEDSALYRFGFNRGLRGEKEYPGEPPVQKMGRWEGQNAAKNAPKKKMKSGGIMKAKSGKSFPDLTGDGKVTRADILKGRGVIKNGGKLKKSK